MGGRVHTSVGYNAVEKNAVNLIGANIDINKAME